MKREWANPPRVMLLATIVLLAAASGLASEFARVPQVGIIVGHWQDGSGATCEDGLREVDVTLDVAQLVAADLEKAGYRVDLLAEFDERLLGYRALAVVSLHADSCILEHTGFKVARHVDSAIPEVDDGLVDCLWAEYERSTQLTRDQLHITLDMCEYHAFQEVASSTPSAIVELGYLGGDRGLLTERQETVARGVTAGVRCFLETYLPNQ
jgi:N-acetylmuramoyl-L-alanine amidase